MHVEIVSIFAVTLPSAERTLEIHGLQLMDVYGNITSMEAFPVESAAECAVLDIPLEFPQYLVQLRAGDQIPK